MVFIYIYIYTIYVIICIYGIYGINMYVIYMSYILIFPSGSDGKESACNAGDPGLLPVSGRSPGEGNGYPFQYPCLENPTGDRSPVGYSGWVQKESDMTE